MTPDQAPRRYVCRHCGKTSPTRVPGRDSDPGWDASCMANAIYCRARLPDEPFAPGIEWVAIDEPGGYELKPRSEA